MAQGQTPVLGYLRDLEIADDVADCAGDTAGEQRESRDNPDSSFREDNGGRRR